jgi:hypothetical protein
LWPRMAISFTCRGAGGVRGLQTYDLMDQD